jgi:repressor LexA
MARGLSARQRQLLRLVQAGLASGGEAPTLRALGEAMGGVTPSAVHLQLDALARKGYLRWPRGRPRQVELLRPAEDTPSPGPALWRVPIVGTIAAGRPIDAFETPDGDVLLDPARLRSGSGAGRAELFALRVQGDSMVDACIQDGDVVVVRRQTAAENGQTVVALLEGEQATLKRFYREGSLVRLQPANPYYPAIYAKEVQVQGLVVGVVRYC